MDTPRYPPWSPLSPKLSLTTVADRITWSVLCAFHTWDIKGMVASAWSSLKLLAKEEAVCHDMKTCQQPLQQLMRGGDEASSWQWWVSHLGGRASIPAKTSDDHGRANILPVPCKGPWAGSTQQSLPWIPNLNKLRDSKCSGGASGKEPTCQSRRHKRCTLDSWVGKIPLEESMATHSSILAWRSPWTEEPAGLQSIGLQRVRHDWSDLAHCFKSLFLNTLLYSNKSLIEASNSSSTTL